MAAKRLEKRPAWLLMAASTLLAAALTTAAAKDTDANATALTLADLTVPGASQEYVEACSVFLQAKATDHGKVTYTQAAAALRVVSKSVTHPQLKVRCLFLLTLSELLAGNDAKAAGAAREALETAQAAGLQMPELAPLRDAASAAESSGTFGAATLAAALALDDHGARLIADLARLQRGRERCRAKLERRWQRHKSAMEKLVAEWARDEGLSAGDAEQLRTKLERKYRPKGAVDLTAIEDELVRFSLDLLLK